jgi:integrase
MTSLSLAALAEKYLSYRRKLGYALRDEGEELLRFVTHLERSGHRGAITTKLAVEWATRSKKGSQTYKARRLAFIRRFAMYAVHFDRDTEVPPEGLLGSPYYRRRTPHIYSNRELTALLRATAQLPTQGGLKPRTYKTLLGLLICSGLRISEALGMARGDVDLKSGVLTIRASKFKKSRLVPLHRSATGPLKQYLKERNLYCDGPVPDSFFVTDRQTSLKYPKVHKTFTYLRKMLGWSVGERGAPRLHDLRHTFAVRRVLSWYEEGLAVDERLPALATYMGHSKLRDTYWYLTAVPELFALTASRFERFARAEPADA